MFALISAGISVGLSLGIFGSGGSVLALPILLYLADQDPKVAITGSLLIVALISATTLLLSSARKHIDWQKAWQLGLPSLLGTYLGALLSSQVNAAVQLIVFSILMLMASANMWRTQRTDLGVLPLNIVLLLGFVVGALTGFTGLGGGFLLLPVLMAIGGISFNAAKATSLLLIFANACTGFSKHLWLNQQLQIELDWTLLLMISAFGITGSLLGQKWANGISTDKLRRGFSVFLLVLALFILGQNLLPLS